MKPAILFYGNCQAGALAVIFGADPIIKASFDVTYAASFDDRTSSKVTLTREVVGTTAILFEQHDPKVFPMRALLPPNCLTVTFPSIDLNLLWPLHCANPFNDTPTAETPWGRFFYGDRIIVDCIQRGLSAAETIQIYEHSSAQHLPNLDRFAALEAARLASRDLKCTVTMADFILAHFREKNLFWTVNHPTMAALRELSSRLIERAKLRSIVFYSVQLDATIAGLPPQGPLGELRVPVHPNIANHFKLTWYPDEASKQYGLRREPLTYREYFGQMTECAASVRDCASIGSRT